jgi:hypothetical protein
MVAHNAAMAHARFAKLTIRSMKYPPECEGDEAPFAAQLRRVYTYPSFGRNH